LLNPREFSQYIRDVPLHDAGNCNFNNINYTQTINQNIGIVSTPVIALDSPWPRIYVVGRMKNSTQLFQRLHILDLYSGADLYPPTTIAANLSGISFDPRVQNQRAALAYLIGFVFVAWASFCDQYNYYGWLMAFDYSGQLKDAYLTSRQGAGGGIWMSGQGPVVEDGSYRFSVDPAFPGVALLYFATGNGQPSIANSDDMNSVIQLGLWRSYPPTVYLQRGLQWGLQYLPSNWSFLNNNDLDVGSGGVMMIPNTTKLVHAGKESVMNLFDRSNLQVSQQQIVINPPPPPNDPNLRENYHHVHGAPVYWRGPSGGRVYVGLSRII
jgi:hypothetical protein